MKKSILIVEDEVHIQRLLQMILEKNGCEVTVLNSGAEALTWFKTHAPPDLLLLDIMMPGVDGLQVLKFIKGDPTLKHTCVIMLTALAQENVVLQGIKLGVKDYIRKPFHPKELMERITKVFGQVAERKVS